MIRLRGRDAFDQACYTTNTHGLFSGLSTFYLENDDGKVSLTPDEALRMVNNGELGVENLLCEVQAVWDVLLGAEEEGSLAIHPCQNAVLIFNRDYGPELGSGIRAFAVHTTVFENAALWAMQSPVVEKDYDLDKFLLKLYPRMPLGKGSWQQDLELLRYSIEIAYELIRIFRIDSGSLWSELLAKDLSLLDEGESLFHGGQLLDLVLDRVREAIGRGPETNEKNPSGESARIPLTPSYDNQPRRAKWR